MILEKCGFRYGKYIHKRNNSKYSDLAIYTISKTTKDKGKTGWKKLEKYINKDMPLEAYNNLSRSDLKYLLVALIHGDGKNKTIKSYKVRTHDVCIGNNEIFKVIIQS